ncbi:T-cell surface glycoprotein CD1c isoform X2 [Leptonychotes weddellii]|uniref:T-cell surface glycoprotein CD1c isoform X2 n=1 Tax=Leptonychotes weddellii TaxID=9713 RepID=A0A7F8RFR8_LEPWE|nr:T-cell surface glycoprotein CD1c isoform X2 [Leptonychotes weddellii]
MSASDILSLELVLLAALLPAADSAEATQEHIQFHVIQISSFANHSWAQHQGSGWLGDVQTHGWDSESGTIIFLHSWSKGNFSDEELIDLELLFRVYFIGLTRETEEYASQLHFGYPFEVQMTAGCELHSSDIAKVFLEAAYEGSDFLSFQNMSWVPAPEGDSRAQSACDLINQYEGIKEIVHKLLTNTCPRFALGLFDASKVDYKRQDGTWYLRVTLDVEAEEAAGLSCRVRHSSLGNQDIILYWGHHLSLYLILLAVIVPLMLLIVLALWFKKRCSYQDIP